MSLPHWHFSTIQTSKQKNQFAFPVTSTSQVLSWIVIIPHPKNNVLCTQLKKRHTPYPTSQSEAPFTDLMHSNCNFLFPLVQSLALFPHSHSSFALFFFFLLSPSVCIHLHYFLHSCLHPPQSGFDCQLSSPFFSFFFLLVFCLLQSSRWVGWHLFSLVQLPSATHSLESEWEAASCTPSMGKHKPS